MRQWADMFPFHCLAGQLHAPVVVGGGASQPMAMGGELMTPQQLAEYQQQMSSMQQQHQAALMQHQVCRSARRMRELRVLFCDAFRHHVPPQCRTLMNVRHGMAIARRIKCLL